MNNDTKGYQTLAEHSKLKRLKVYLIKTGLRGWAALGVKSQQTETENGLTFGLIMEGRETNEKETKDVKLSCYRLKTNRSYIRSFGSLVDISRSNKLHLDSTDDWLTSWITLKEFPIFGNVPWASYNMKKSKYWHKWSWRKETVSLE